MLTRPIIGFISTALAPLTWDAGAIVGQGGGAARNERAIKTKGEGNEFKKTGCPGYSPGKYL